MEIRSVLRGEGTSFVPRSTQKTEKTAGTVPASTDRLELTRQMVQTMGEQQARLEALLRDETDKEKSGGILDMLDDTSAESDELDALSKELDVQMKCMKIAMNIMRGKKVPPEDERYLMENDPDGYKLAIAMRSLAKEDDEECESVLEDEDKNGETEETSGSEESAAPAEGSSGSGGEAVE